MNDRNLFPELDNIGFPTVEKVFKKGVWIKQPYMFGMTPTYYNFQTTPSNKYIGFGYEKGQGYYFSAINGNYYFKDYGISWAFTKEELDKFYREHKEFFYDPDKEDR